MIVFLDTNILFSALAFPDTIPDLALKKALLFDDYEVYTSKYCLEELRRNYIKKISSDVRLLDIFINYLLESVSLADEVNDESALELLIRDQKDKPILRAAINCNADLLITGDRDFLDSPIIRPKSIKPREFFENY